MPSLDRFAQGRPDPQVLFEQLIGYCVVCGSEIYPDDEVCEVDGVIICAELDCMVQYTCGRKLQAKELVK